MTPGAGRRRRRPPRRACSAPGARPAVRPHVQPADAAPAGPGLGLLDELGGCPTPAAQATSASNVQTTKPRSSRRPGARTRPFLEYPAGPLHAGLRKPSVVAHFCTEPGRGRRSPRTLLPFPRAAVFGAVETHNSISSSAAPRSLTGDDRVPRPSGERVGGRRRYRQFGRGQASPACRDGDARPRRTRGDGDQGRRRPRDRAGRAMRRRVRSR